MKVAGLCAVCGKPSTELFQCKKCGAMVCGEHYDFKTGFCSNCLKGRVL